MSQLLTTLTLIPLLAVSVHADLRIKTRIDVRRTVPASGSAQPDLGAAFQTAMPSAEAIMFVSGAAVRIEQSGGGSGSILLIRPNEQVLLDPQARTYTRIPLTGVLSRTAQGSASTVRRTGEFQTLLGLRAERVETALTVPLPVIPPPGFPTVIRMTGELWVADAHRRYAEVVRKALMLSTHFPSEIEGMVLRQTLRSQEFGVEIEYAVTEMVEGPIAAELFDLPPGYRRQP